MPHPVRLALFALVLWVVPAAAAPASHVELAGKVTGSRTVLGQRRVGAARYVAISDLFYRDKAAIAEILDLSTQQVIQVKARRATLERRFGSRRNGVALPPQAEVVLYREGITGLAVEQVTDSARRLWYAELDARGRIVRSAELASLTEDSQLAIVGADPTGSEAWFAVTETAGGHRTVALRRLDLATLAVHDEQRVALIPRGRGGDHAVTVHAAADFSQFAIVEYVEADVGMSPGHVYIVDPASGASFTVVAPPTAYGVAFSADNRYIYLGSAQHGTISRIDVAAHKLDRQVAGPRYLHHLVISPGGTRLFALASSSSYAVYDLPDLRTRADAGHPAELAPAMAELHGNGIASLDGAFFIAPAAEPRRASSPDRSYLIARLVE
ncbi:MAG TPA: hypothetical protein VGC42_21205 [Kofleriaceae bacterium]